MSRKMVTVDGNEAAAFIAHKTNEVCAIYPITPSSNMGEWADAWSAQGRTNIWGTVPTVVEMQSEGGAAGAVHGALQTGALTTTFTASQGLLLMIPNMYKIAGELTSTVFHVSARTLATHALSIFGDHSDVMSTRATGFGILAAASVQEVHDLALIAQAATLEARIPLIHFFDGFRTSHEVQKIELATDAGIRAMLPDDLIRAHRQRALNPNRPVLRGSAQNPDVFFQAREAGNRYYQAAPEIIQKAMDRFAGIFGRQYHLFDYSGDPEAERVIVIMASGAETVRETVAALNDSGGKTGVLTVRLYRPFAPAALVAALPASVRRIAVLDRTKEPGSLGEPLYQDVLTALLEQSLGENPPSSLPLVTGGRYGLSSKEFTPAMVKGIFDELQKDRPRNHFTIGINDDVTHTSLDYDPEYTLHEEKVFRGMFYGLGSDGTVSANKNSIKIIGEETPNFSQGYFVYDSKKAGSITISHLRFGKEPIHAPYLIQRANFIACHHYVFLETHDVLQAAVPGGTFLLNCPYPADEVWDRLPRQVQAQIVEKKLKFYAINALRVARETGLGVRINTIMQTCFFALSGVLPRDEALRKIKESIKKSYGKKGGEVVKMNYAAVDQTLKNLFEVPLPDRATSKDRARAVVPDQAPQFVKDVTARIIAGQGDSLPVSAFTPDGTWPTATTQWEKRNIASEIPVWDPGICIQCNKCALVCPHAAIRMKVVAEDKLGDRPETFKSIPVRGKEWAETDQYILQVAPEDCTGCALCVEACPVKDKTDTKRKAINMEPQLPLRDTERVNWDYFLSLPEVERGKVRQDTVKGSQLLQPLFEFSGACAGCGETPYLKLATQLFGDRMIVANATGCSSIYGGNLPTTPWARNASGRGPSWSNSLFEDNAEFGMGFRLSIDQHHQYARKLLEHLRPRLGGELVEALLNADQREEAGIFEQRERVEELQRRLGKLRSAEARNLRVVADNLVRKSVWIVGGDGWAYDIGFGGLDHVLASDADVNILVLDTEVYSNTGGQASKATPLGAVAKFAAAGKPANKKDLGMMAMSYGNAYVAQVAMGASDLQTVKAFLEAESYPGPSMIIAYSHCIAHGYNMRYGLQQQSAAVDSGHWILYRFDPRLAEEGKNPLRLDSKAPKLPIRDYLYNETRYKMLAHTMPERARVLLEAAQRAAQKRYETYRRMAAAGPGGKQDE